jgi:hypothetical protein
MKDMLIQFNRKLCLIAVLAAALALVLLAYPAMILTLWAVNALDTKQKPPEKMILHNH